VYPLNTLRVRLSHLAASIWFD